MTHDEVYQMFRSDPDRHRSSYLHNHYKRGKAGVMRPEESQVQALAAWRAGRDAAIEAGLQQGDERKAGAPHLTIVSTPGVPAAPGCNDVVPLPSAWTPPALVLGERPSWEFYDEASDTVMEAAVDWDHVTFTISHEEETGRIVVPADQLDELIVLLTKARQAQL